MSHDDHNFEVILLSPSGVSARPRLVKPNAKLRKIFQYNAIFGQRFEQKNQKNVYLTYGSPKKSVLSCRRREYRLQKICKAFPRRNHLCKNFARHFPARIIFAKILQGVSQPESSLQKFCKAFPHRIHLCKNFARHFPAGCN